MRASPGMLMGMMNTGSTIMDLLAEGYSLDPKRMSIIHPSFK
jgi:hypothetical protein